MTGPMEPLGFPNCRYCAYLRNGPPSTCLTCATQTFMGIVRHACPICSQSMTGDQCPNWLCSDPNRSITRIQAIAYHNGSLRDAIIKYKYQEKNGWSLVFGRLLLAWLNQHARSNPPILIIANPTYMPPGDAGSGHTERVIEVAAAEDVLDEWPFDIAEQRALIKTRDTQKSAGKPATEKRKAAQELRTSILVKDRARIEGGRMLIYEDVCTTGNQLNAIAQCLIEDGGAAEVSGIVLARAPWKTDQTP